MVAMNTLQLSSTGWSGPKAATVVLLLVGALGIALLWAAGVEFPFLVPPGLLILLGGAAFVGLAPWRWAPAVGAVLGLFVTVGFLISPTGVPNLLGHHGLAVAIGQCVQVIGVFGALIIGALATRANYRSAVRV